MKRTGLLCGVLSLLALLAFYAGAQDNRPGKDIPAGGLPLLPAAPPPSPPPTLREQLKAESIDSLLGKLKALKAQQAELARVEQETVAVLKEKLQEQKQQLSKLGVNLEGNDPLPSPEPSPTTKK
jgi:hypothetical protein